MRRLIAACCCLARRPFCRRAKYEVLSASAQAALHQGRFGLPAERHLLQDADGSGRLAGRHVAPAGKTHSQPRIPDRSVAQRPLRGDPGRTRPAVGARPDAGRIGLPKYAVSSAGARGYMQVMPFWVKLIGRPTTRYSTCAPTCATAAPSCATTWISRRATSTVPWAATTAAWANRNIEYGSCRMAEPVGSTTSRPAWRRPATNQRPRPCRATCPSCRASTCRCRPSENCFIIFCVCSN